MSDLERLRYDAWTRQLERMRAMQYAYHRKFFGLLLVSTLVGGVALAWGSVFSLIAVCFGLVTTGVSAAFLLHFCNFARTHARALEGQINRLLQQRTLIASELEADYFYPPQSPVLDVGELWPSRFFDFYTRHFCGLWAIMTGWALWQLWHHLLPEPFLVLMLAWAAWAGVNVVYVQTWFRGAAEQRMAERLKAELGQPL
jgi:hypothetical protein